MFGPEALKWGASGIVMNPSDVVVVELGYRPWFSRYTLGAREADRDRRRRGA